LAGDTKALTKYKHLPVDVKTFVEGEYYLNAPNILYPVVMENLIAINEGEYDEVVLTGGIGAAKSTLALYTQAYQLYLLSCMASSQNYFGLDLASEIIIIFQSLNAKLAQEVDYDRFKSMVEHSPYFREKFPFSKFVDTQLEFPNRVIVKPVSGLETAAIGQNVIGGVIDEVNFMAVIENSRMAEGTVYDQATALYNSIARRRKSRFMSRGRMPGRLCLVSSRRTPGQFTDKKEEEAKINPRIYVYDKRVWEVKPKGTFGEERFLVFIGDGGRQPRILRPEEEVHDRDRELVDHVPIEFLSEFNDDITKALRDIAGRSTLAIHPYLPRREDVLCNFGRRKNVFVRESVDFAREKVQLRTNLIRLSKEPRWAHIDLGVSSDSAGLCIGHVNRFEKVDRGGHNEVLPIIEIDGVLEVIPPRGTGGEIDFASIRRILYKLRDMGMPIKWVTLDSFQSVDTMQILRQQGFVTGYVSVDKTMIPYDLTKQALYDHRLLIPEHQKLQRELTSLERDFKKGKIDHPPKGSKDTADALAGVVFGLTTRREIWLNHKVSIHQAISVASMIRDQEYERGENGEPVPPRQTAQRA
jgi:hypothetical protein